MAPAVQASFWAMGVWSNYDTLVTCNRPECLREKMDSTFPNRQQEIADAGEACFWPETEAEQESVRQEMDRIVSSKFFISSKRYPTLLKYVVDEALAGRANQLKERTIGIDVFGRDADYNSNLDPVVRTSAAQVRRRLAQYYANSNGGYGVRIELRSGSYAPIFRQLQSTTNGHAADVWDLQAQVAEPDTVAAEIESEPLAAEPGVALTESAAGTPTVGRQFSRNRLTIYTLVLVAIGLMAWAVASRWLGPSAEAKFWAPVWDKLTPIVICVPGRFPTNESVAQISDGTRVAGAPLSIGESLRLNSIAWPDATTLFRIVGFAEKHGQPYYVRRAGDSSLSDLRTGQVILIGGLNNPWILRLTNSYRYSFRNDRGGGVAWIQDAQNPDRMDWKVDVEAPYSWFDEDYGVITRVWDSTTERLIIVASGIASYGTIAAGEFLTNPRYLEMIEQKAPKGWERKNLQVVFTTKVFSGNASPPVIVAVHVW